MGVVGARPLMPGVQPQEGAVRLVVYPLRRNVGHAGARNGCSNSSLPGGDASLDGLLTSIPTAARIAPRLLLLVRCGLYPCHTRPVNGYQEPRPRSERQPLEQALSGIAANPIVDTRYKTFLNS